jgi:ribosome-binding protein aMBF1 (putative translation factor)
MDGMTNKKGGGLRARPMTNREYLDRTEEGRVIDEQQRAIVEVTQALWTAMQEAGFSNSDLARELGVDRSVVTKMLRGQQGLSLERLAHAFHVLGFSLRVGYGPAAKRQKGKAG